MRVIKLDKFNIPTLKGSIVIDVEEGKDFIITPPEGEAVDYDTIDRLSLALYCFDKILELELEKLIVDEYLIPQIIASNMDNFWSGLSEHLQSFFKHYVYKGDLFNDVNIDGTGVLKEHTASIIKFLLHVFAVGGKGESLSVTYTIKIFYLPD